MVKTSLSQHRGTLPEAATNQKLPRLGHLPELDGIRGIAALMVVFHHLCFTEIDPTQWTSGIVSHLYSLASFGDAGVDVFFVLSGFLISSLLIRDRESPDYYRDFYWKRVLRILPLYAVTVIGILIFIPGYGRFVLLCVLFLANFANVFHVTPIGPFWTLAIEEQFYLLWPTVVRRRSVASLRHWAFAIICAVIALRFVFAYFGHHNYWHTYLHCDGLALGALLACMLERCQRIGQGLAAKRGILLGLLVAGFVMLSIASFIPLDDARHLAFHSATGAAGITFLCGGFVGTSIAYTGRPWLGVLRSRILTFFGLISYALYMVHLFVRDYYDKLRPLHPNDLTGYFVRIAVVLAVTVVITLITRYTIELPVMSLRKYVLHRPTKPVVAEPLAQPMQVEPLVKSIREISE